MTIDTELGALDARDRKIVALAVASLYELEMSGHLGSDAVEHLLEIVAVVAPECSAVLADDIDGPAFGLLVMRGMLLETEVAP